VHVLSRELEDRIGDLNAESTYLYGEMRRLQAAPTTIAVLDTNVLMMDHSRLTEMPWHQLSETRDMQLVRVIIPIIVVDELDALKRSSGEMRIGGKGIPRRTVARQALRTVSGMFQQPSDVYSFDQSDDALIRRPVTIELLMDAPFHKRLSSPDAEIRDRALSLKPYAQRTVLVTYDLGNQFSAEAIGLATRRLTDADDTSQ